MGWGEPQRPGRPQPPSRFRVVGFNDEHAAWPCLLLRAPGTGVITTLTVPPAVWAEVVERWVPADAWDCPRPNVGHAPTADATGMVVP